MSLASGTKLAEYEILSLLGVGGMGEVYRARDTKLRREVAIKVLPEEFSGDKERLARFEREARALASLNHPNIAAIYGFEQAEGLHYLVMELVPGDTLAELLMKGRLSVEEALSMAAADGRGRGGGPRERDHSSRLEAGQRQGDRGGKGHRAGLRPGEGFFRRHAHARGGFLPVSHVDARCDPSRRHPGNGRLYEPGAGAREVRRQEKRRLRLRQRCLRNADGRESVSRRGHLGDSRRRDQDGAGLVAVIRRPRPEDPKASRALLREGPARASARYR